MAECYVDERLFQGYSEGIRATRMVATLHKAHQMQGGGPRRWILKKVIIVRIRIALNKVQAPRLGGVNMVSGGRPSRSPQMRKSPDRWHWRKEAAAIDKSPLHILRATQGPPSATAFRFTYMRESHPFSYTT